MAKKARRTTHRSSKGTKETICAATAGRHRKRFKSRTGAAARPSIFRCPPAMGGGPPCRSGSPTLHRTRCVGWSRGCRTGRVPVVSLVLGGGH
jgi:hypothetical protein